MPAFRRGVPGLSLHDGAILMPVLRAPQQALCVNCSTRSDLLPREFTEELSQLQVRLRDRCALQLSAETLAEDGSTVREAAIAEFVTSMKHMTVKLKVSRNTTCSRCGAVGVPLTTPSRTAAHGRYACPVAVFSF